MRRTTADLPTLRARGAEGARAPGVLFAAAAAAAWIPWVVLTAPLLGAGAALTGYVITVTAAYITVLCAYRYGAAVRRLLAAFLLAVAAGALLAAITDDLPALAVGLALLLGLGRSGLIDRAAPARALLVELALLGAGLGLASCFAGPPLRSATLALWAFFLVQSLYAVLRGARRSGDASRERDAFDDAHRRAVALLER